MSLLTIWLSLAEWGSLSHSDKTMFQSHWKDIHINFMCSTAPQLRPWADGLKNAIELG